MILTRFCITYHMDNQECTAESCVTIPVSDDYATILRHQGADGYLSHMIYSLLHYLCDLQGYRFTEICTIEEVNND